MTVDVYEEVPASRLMQYLHVEQDFFFVDFSVSAMTSIVSIYTLTYNLAV